VSWLRFVDRGLWRPRWLCWVFVLTLMCRLNSLVETTARWTFLSGVEAICETVIALAMAAAISISLLSLSAHLNEAKALRQGGESPRQSAAEHRLPSVAHVARAETASHYN
jgi:hypothetical protein